MMNLQYDHCVEVDICADTEYYYFSSELTI